MLSVLFHIHQCVSPCPRCNEYFWSDLFYTPLDWIQEMMPKLEWEIKFKSCKRKCCNNFSPKIFLLAPNNPPSLSVSPAINGTLLNCPRVMSFSGSSGRNGEVRSLSTRGPNATGYTHRAWCLYNPFFMLYVHKQCDEWFMLLKIRFIHTNRITFFFLSIIICLALLLLRHWSNCRESEVGQFKLLAKLWVYSPTVFCSAHGHLVDPDWAIALWNNPVGKIFKKQKKF